jgi:hypothetical protein
MDMDELPPTPTPDPEAARADLHAWLERLDDEVLLTLWAMAYWLERSKGRHEDRGGTQPPGR